jgi:AhpD family alkylhydroperoxidase
VSNAARPGLPPDRTAIVRPGTAAPRAALLPTISHNRRPGKDSPLLARRLGSTPARRGRGDARHVGQSNSALPAATQELVKIRASQINGCAYCTDMRTEDAAHAGESQVRLNLVAGWREATVFACVALLSRS